VRTRDASLVNVTLPIFSEEARLARSLPRLHRFLSESFRLPLEFQIVIANNGSTDRTQEIAERFSRELPNVRVLQIPEKGRGGAVKRAWLESEAEVLTYMDVDLATDLEAFPALVEAVASGQADIAIASRLLAGSKTNRSWRRDVISRAYVRLARALCGLRCSDAQCGFKAISRTAAQALLPQVQDNGWFFDTELLVRAQCGGWRIAEVPVKWTEDRDSRVRIVRTAWEDVRGLMRLRRELARNRKAGEPSLTGPESSGKKMGAKTRNANSR
jgi:glycosyltransferase involved in cell wall biosynthesis